VSLISAAAWPQQSNAALATGSRRHRTNALELNIIIGLSKD
jgi:hypothetical protein